jgi:hypothetical protein
MRWEILVVDDDPGSREFLATALEVPPNSDQRRIVVLDMKDLRRAIAGHDELPLLKRPPDPR